MTEQERFWAKVNKNTDTGCWEWTGTLTHGYGQISIGGKKCYGGKMVRTHRYSWILYKGPIQDGLKVLHKCDNRKCVNPDHLFLGTGVDNMEDMKNKGRSPKVKLYGPANGMYRRNHIDRAKGP